MSHVVGTITNTNQVYNQKGISLDHLDHQVSPSMPHSTEAKAYKLDKLSTIPTPIRKQGDVLLRT